MNNDKIKQYLIDFFEKTDFEAILKKSYYAYDDTKKHYDHNHVEFTKEISKTNIKFYYSDDDYNDGPIYTIINIELGDNECHFYGHAYGEDKYENFDEKVDTTDINEFIDWWHSGGCFAGPTESFPAMNLVITDIVNSAPIKDFIYKIDDSDKLKVQSNYDSIDAFFDNTDDESFKNHESISIISVDTKTPLIKIEKTQDKTINTYKFIVDITNEDGDSYNIKSIINSKEKLEQLLKSTIDSLRNYPQFSKYADDLDNCL